MAGDYEKYKGTKWLKFEGKETPDEHLQRLINQGPERVRQNIIALFASYDKPSAKFWNPLHGKGRKWQAEANALVTFCQNFEPSGDKASDVASLLTHVTH
ncbi:hypothetical protein [Legionella israelensis]|uniref:Uncharacterized protein n=1 Tax=Legionella israelensis TaxID=454 RepID=A0A0W0VJF1_9GAMM|nr:hypothetical protein [Legionella israelensis]KTD20238.1 hypothetical protein Lisr_1789 [Legionella israelensis]QBS09179.1 hypothetical protein E4T55_04500 [Legionella israelensis]SCY22491.1 hypothetical protein SAMN02746069_01699 [Legionella israelensis DSM 19235]STX58910.1 Uncharacterised protein [Legionella israelensis]